MLVKEKATSEKFMLLTFSLISQTHLSLNLSVIIVYFYKPISLCILAKVVPPFLGGGVTAHCIQANQLSRENLRCNKSQTNICSHAKGELGSLK